MRPASFFRRALPRAITLIAALVLGLGLLAARPVFGLETYTVKAGDTLLAIGARLGVDDEALMDWADEVVELNDLDSADALTVGEKLTLPASTRGSSASASATTRTANPLPPASAVTYTVKSGDSLYEIALRTGIGDSSLTSWIDDVVKLNKLPNPDALVAGASLQLPGTRGATSTTAPTSGGVRNNGITGSITYTVKSGDTLLDIAINQGVKEEEQSAYIEDIVKLSGLSGPDSIAAGQVLKLPNRKTSDVLSSDGAGPSASNTSNTSVTSSTSTYTVKDGDSLYDIAASLGVPDDKQGAWLKDVLQLNAMDDANVLRAGQALKVPDGYKPKPAANATATGPTTTATPASDELLIRAPGATSCLYTVRTGDTLAGVSVKLGIPEVDKQNWTTYVSLLNGVDANALPVGNGLRIPC